MKNFPQVFNKFLQQIFEFFASEFLHQRRKILHLFPKKPRKLASNTKVHDSFSTLVQKTKTNFESCKKA